MTEKERIEIPLELSEYSFARYITYVLYTPLYMAGPVVTFNDFWRQVSSNFISLTLSNGNIVNEDTVLDFSRPNFFVRPSPIILHSHNGIYSSSHVRSSYFANSSMGK